MTTKIEDGKVVSFHYTLKDDDGETLDSSAGEAPLAYMQGAGNIVPGLEREMLGHAVGDTFRVVVAPADGYGERQAEGQAEVPLSDFPEDAELEPGMALVLQDDQGREHPVWVIDIEEDLVILDVNHPLAGVTLHFEVEIDEIRDPTDEEKAHGHAHNPDDQHH